MLQEKAPSGMLLAHEVAVWKRPPAACPVCALFPAQRTC